jgi:hypothetical protein
VLAHQFASHLNMTAAFPVPLVALVVLRYVRGELSARGLSWRLGLIVALEAYISTEASVTLALALALALVVAWALVREARVRIVSTVAPVVTAYALALLLTAPLAYYAVTGLTHGANAFSGFFSADLLNLVVPTHVTGLGGHSLASVSSRFPGDDAERDSYLGLPVLLIAGLLVWRRPRAASTRFLVAAFAVATFLSLGTALYVNGHRLVWLPWSAVSHWTGLEEIVPSRFALYATLAVAAMAAIWVSSTRGKFVPYVLPLLAVAALVPPVWAHDSVQQPPRWEFFTHANYKVCIPRGETLLIFPFGRWGDTLLWQAEANFWFRMSEGTLGHNNQPKNFASDPTNDKLLYQFLDPATRPTTAELLGLAKRRHIDRIVSVATPDAYPSGTDMHAFGPLQLLGDVFVAPACGYNSLAGDTRLPPQG